MTRTIQVRAPRFAFDRAIPRAWLAGSTIATTYANALSLIFPEGERFFIRSVRHYLAEIEEDPELAARVKGFVGQEGRHGHAHDRMNKMIEEHGYDVRGFLALYHRVAYEHIEQVVPPHLNLASTVALEHLTATFAEAALRTPLLEDADPVVRALLRWHAAEEIEHKSVAFDVLMRVDPRYSTRMAGLAIGVTMLVSFWALAFAMLIRQEGAITLDPARAERFRESARHFDRIVFAAARDYLRRDFHPDDRDNAHLAHEAIAELGDSLPA